MVPYISVSYLSTSYFWFFLSLRFPILNMRFLMSVYPMFGVSYFCVPIFMSSHLHVTLKMGWHHDDDHDDHYCHNRDHLPSIISLFRLSRTDQTIGQSDTFDCYKRNPPTLHMDSILYIFKVRIRKKGSQNHVFRGKK